MEFQSYVFGYDEVAHAADVFGRWEAEQQTAEKKSS
jgi:hypothetical protein